MIEEGAGVDDFEPAAAFGEGGGDEAIGEERVDGFGDPIGPGADGGGGPGGGARGLLVRVVDDAPVAGEAAVSG